MRYGEKGNGWRSSRSPFLCLFHRREEGVGAALHPRFVGMVRNILLQNQCILDLGDHLSMPYDHLVGADILNALDPANPRKFLCTPVLPISGG